MVQDSNAGDSDDDISSMHSDFLRFGGGHRQSRTYSGAGLSDTSSEMEAKSDFSDDINNEIKKRVIQINSET